MNLREKEHECRFLKHEVQLNKYKLWLNHLEGQKCAVLEDQAILEVLRDDIRTLLQYLEHACKKYKIFELLDGSEDCIPFINIILDKSNYKCYLKLRNIMEYYNNFTDSYKLIFKNNYIKMLKCHSLYCKHCVKNFF